MCPRRESVSTNRNSRQNHTFVTDEGLDLVRTDDGIMFAIWDGARAIVSPEFHMAGHNFAPADIWQSEALVETVLLPVSFTQYRPPLEAARWMCAVYAVRVGKVYVVHRSAHG